MFRGFGKFSLLLAGAALLVVSCGQGPVPNGVAAPRAAAPLAPIEDLSDIYLDYQATQALVRAVKRDSTIKMAEQALSRSNRSLEWDKALAVHFNDPTARILMVNAGKDLVLYVTAEQKPLQTIVHAALLVSPLEGSGNTNQAAMSELTGGLVMHVTAGKNVGDPGRIDDWGPRQGTRNLSELMAIGPETTRHHPEIPPVEPCQGPGPFAKADPCAAEEKAVQKAGEALQDAKDNLWDAVSRTVLGTGGTSLVAWNSVTPEEGWQCDFVNDTLVCNGSFNAGQAGSALIAAGGAAGAYFQSKPRNRAVNDAKEAVKKAQEALDKCRGDDPPPGDYCLIPIFADEDLALYPGFYPPIFNTVDEGGIDWRRVGAITLAAGAVVALGTAVVVSGGAAAAAMAAASQLLRPLISRPPSWLPLPLELPDSPVSSDLFIAPALPPLEIVSRDPAPLVFE